MVEDVGVVILTERRNSKALKVNFRTVRRSWINRKIASDCSKKYDIKDISKNIESEAILILAYNDYSTIYVVVRREGRLGIVKYEHVGIYYSIVDAVNEHFQTDSILSKRNWSREFSEGLKTNKSNEIGIYECWSEEKCDKKESLKISNLSCADLVDRICYINEKVPTTLLMMMCSIENIKNIVLWNDENVIEVVQKDEYGYALELNSKSFELIKDIIIGS